MAVWFIYELPPIDEGWDYLSSAEDVAVELAAGTKGNEATTEFLGALQTAMRLARDAGFEGDYRITPRVFWLPGGDEGDMNYAFIWKQDNNGTTFVASPYPLPWLSLAA